VSFLKTRDILNPIIIFSIPFLIAIVLHSLSLSDFYISNYLINSFVAFLIPIFFAIGALMPLLVSSFSNLTLFELKKKHHKGYYTNVVLATILFVGVTVLEGNIYGFPIFSNSPTHAYTTYGFPVLHHLTSLAYFAIVLVILTVRVSIASKLFASFILILALLSFFPLLARMMLLNLFIVLLFSIYYFYSWSGRQVLFFGLIVVAAFLALFIYIGLFRASTDSFSLFNELAKINCDCLGPFSMVYLYLTISLQNTINLISEHEKLYFGLNTITSLLPLVSLSDLTSLDLNNYRASRGLTTFIFGTGLYLDFGVLSLVPIFFVGVISSLVYILFRQGRLFFTLVYLCGLVRSLIFGFFSDTLFTTSLVVTLIFSLIFSYRWKLSLK
jgi:oligosaccharide repeat unit polymerase